MRSAARRPIIPRDQSEPLLALRERTGLTLAGAAAARGIAWASEQQQEQQGRRILLTTLDAAAAALGYRVVVGFEKIDTRE